MLWLSLLLCLLSHVHVQESLRLAAPADDESADVDVPELHLAAQNGDVAAVRQILANNTEKRPWCVDRHTFCPWRRVKDRRQSFVNSQGPGGHTALHYAVVAGHQDVAAMLLDHGAKVDARDNRQLTPLVCAIMKGRAAMVQFLLSRGANGAARIPRVGTPLTVAVRFGRLDVVRAMLEQGVNVNQSDSFSRSPAHYAAREKNAEMLKLLATYGADMNVFDSHHMPLLLLATMDPATLRVALDHGARMDAKVFGVYRIFDICLLGANRDCVTEAYRRNMSDRPRDASIACYTGQTRSLEILLDCGLDVNTVLADGGAMLHLATTLRNLNLVKTLVRRGANLSATNNRGETASDIAGMRPGALQSFLFHSSMILKKEAAVVTPCKVPCDEAEDPLSHEPFEGRVIIRSPELSNAKKCFLVRSLLTWLTIRETNPLSNEPYTLNQLGHDMAKIDEDGTSLYPCVAIAG